MTWKRAADRWRERLGAVALETFRYRVPKPVEDWALEDRRMRDNERYTFAFAPYQQEMLIAPYGDDVQLTVYAMASRTGKTETFKNIIGHSIAEDPRDILVMYPTDLEGERFSKEELDGELFGVTPSLNFLESGNRRKTSNTIRHKLFPGGHLDVLASRSPNKIRRAKGNLLIADEVDGIPAIEGDQGDPVEILWYRGSQYDDTIKIAASYPGAKGASRIWDFLLASDFRKWFTPCVRCSEFIIMLREHLRYPPGKPEKAVLECPECSGTITDEDRREMVMAGEWRATRPFTGVRGYWANGMISPHPVQKGFKSHLHYVANREIAIAKSREPERDRQVLVTTFDAEPYEPEQIGAPDPDALAERLENYDPRDLLPPGVLVITGGVDIQKSYIDVSVWGWGLNQESWLLERERLDGDPEHPATWKKLWDFLAGCVYDRENGRKLGLYRQGSAVLVDAGNDPTTVTRQTFAHRGQSVFACNGSPNIAAPILGTPRTAPLPYPGKVFPIGVNSAKNILYNRLSILPGNGTPGFVHLNRKSATNDFLKGLTCEYGVEEYQRGRVYVRYKNPKGARNEPLDCFVYAFAALELVNPDFEKIAENLEIDPKERKNKRKAARKKRGYTLLKRRSF